MSGMWAERLEGSFRKQGARQSVDAGLNPIKFFLGGIVEQPVNVERVNLRIVGFPSVGPTSPPNKPQQRGHGRNPPPAPKLKFSSTSAIRN